MGILLLTVLLAYSRGALLALAVGCAFWFVVVPLRLRGVAVLAVGALGALAVAVWAFAQDALTKDSVPLDERATSGHQLGVAVLAMALVLLAAGPGDRLRGRAARAVGAAPAGAWARCPRLPRRWSRWSSSSRWRCRPRAWAARISHGWNSLTDPNARRRSSTTRPPDLVGSVRARYWDEALKIFRGPPVAGVGAGGYATARLRYRNDNLEVQHAHGYVVQTLADLGIIGLLVSLALLVAWSAAGRTRPALPGLARAGRRRPARRPGYARALGPERSRWRAGDRRARLRRALVRRLDVVRPRHGRDRAARRGWLAGRGPLGQPAPACADARRAAGAGRACSRCG